MATEEVVRRFGVFSREGAHDVEVGQAVEYVSGLIGVYFEPGQRIRCDGNMLTLVPHGYGAVEEDWRDEPTQPDVRSDEITRPGLPHNVVRPAKR